jgi:hypothetical protein
MIKLELLKKNGKLSEWLDEDEIDSLPSPPPSKFSSLNNLPFGGNKILGDIGWFY